jgi:hypothetical protein
MNLRDTVQLCVMERTLTNMAWKCINNNDIAGIIIIIISSSSSSSGGIGRYAASRKVAGSSPDLPYFSNWPWGLLSLYPKWVLEDLFGIKARPPRKADKRFWSGVVTCLKEKEPICEPVVTEESLYKW